MNSCHSHINMAALWKHHTHLLLIGHLPCDQQPEQTLRQRLLTSRCFWQQLLTFWDAVAPETDTLSRNKGCDLILWFQKVNLNIFQTNYYDTEQQSRCTTKTVSYLSALTHSYY